MQFPDHLLLEKVWYDTACAIFEAASSSLPPRNVLQHAKGRQAHVPPQLLNPWLELRRYKRRYYKHKTSLNKSLFQRAKQQWYNRLATHIAQEQSTRLKKVIASRNLRVSATPSSPPLVRRADGSQATSHQEGLNNLAQFYSAFFNSVPRSPLDDEIESEVFRFFSAANFSTSTNPITLFDIKLATSRLTNSSPGEDCVHTLLITHAPSNLPRLLHFIFNLSVRAGITPDEWLRARVFPLLKPGDDPFSPSSYRLISITSVVARLLERIMSVKMLDHLNSSNFFHCLQAGFRAGFSTIDHILLLWKRISDHLLRSKPMPAVFLDLQKAFDSVPLSSLFLKLIRSGLPPYIIRWLRSFLTGRSMTLAHGSLRSPPFTLLKGVPQGCCLSPLLFLIFINDLPTFVQRTCPSSSPFFDFLLFADDIAIIPKTFLTDTQWPVHLQQVLEAVFCWTRSWKLTINAKKSALLLFCNLVNRPRPPCLLIGFDLLPLHSTYKYLGVTFSDDARWNCHFVKLVRSIESSTRNLCQSYSLLPRPLSPDLLVLACHQLIYSKITYALPILSYTEEQYNTLESLILRPIKMNLLLPFHTSHASLLIEHHLPDLRSLHAASIVRLTDRATLLPRSHTSRTILTTPIRTATFKFQYLSLPNERLEANYDKLHHLLRLAPEDRSHLSLFELARTLRLRHLDAHGIHDGETSAYLSLIPPRARPDSYSSLDSPATAQLRLRLRLSPSNPRSSTRLSFQNHICPKCHAALATASPSSSHLLLDCQDPTLRTLRSQAILKIRRTGLIRNKRDPQLLHALLGHFPPNTPKALLKEALDASKPLLHEIFDHYSSSSSESDSD